MKTKSLSFASIGPLFVLSGRAALADVAPPVGPIVALSVGALIAVGFAVTAAVVVAILVIRAVKKSRGPKNQA